MAIAALRDEIAAGLVGFAWDQWTQIGVSGAPPEAAEQRAIDPEALLAFSYALEHHDPRLFGEILDWLALNAGLMSRQRLTNLAAGRSLTPESTFERSFKSQAPELGAPINLAFRLRQIFGRGVRAEIVRALLTSDSSRVAVGVLNATSGFADRNVREGLGALTDAGAVQATVIGGTRYYAMNPESWSEARGPGHPRHFDWIPALRAAGELMRWLDDPAHTGLSDYLTASAARQLVDRLEPDLRFAGIPTYGHTARGAAYGDDFERTVRGLVAALRG